MELRGIHKRFGLVLANRGVDLRVHAGSVHAVMGENGAGKSTLMKVAYGQLRADAGSITLRGESVGRTRHSPRHSLGLGVGMVHQHFMLVDTLTVAENLVLGDEPRRRGVLDLRGVADRIRARAEDVGLAVEPYALIESLSVGQRQRVEILKVLWQGSEVLILDEPTAVLTPGEVRELFDVFRRLVAGGKTIVLITHKIDEVMDIADRVTVMRRGEVSAELEPGAMSADQIVRAMVGRTVARSFARSDASPGEVALEVAGLHVAGRGELPAVRGVDLRVRAGEILGIAGVEGNGQSELVEAVVGLRRVTGGTVLIGGVDVTGSSVRERRAAGLSHVPEDRHARGLVLDYSVADNLVLGQQRGFVKRFGLDRPRIEARAASLIAEYDIRPASGQVLARALSGGNQQKVVVARELGRDTSRILVCSQPTRGVDIGAIEAIHRRILAARDAGMAVLLVSAELDELRSLADRVAVMFEGQILASFERHELGDEGAAERMGELMTGALHVEAQDA